MFQIVVFDIDNTLAQLNMPIEQKVITDILEIEKSGIRVILASGKPAIYLSGLARQIGLENPIIIGENGCTIYYSKNIPPHKVIKTNISSEQKALIKKIKIDIGNEFNDSIWFQPNVINITCFHYNNDTRLNLESYIHNLFENRNINDNLVYYEHNDSIDIVPRNINKGTAIVQVAKEENINISNVISVGDGVNDFPMFDVSGYTIGVNLNGKYKVDREFENIADAVNYIKELLKS